MADVAPYMKKFFLVLLAFSMCTLALSAARADSPANSKLRREAKLTQAQAEKIALKRTLGGTAKSGELEREHGHLVWSFDIAKQHSRDIIEVLVDAKDGAIVKCTERNARRSGGRSSRRS